MVVKKNEKKDERRTGSAKAGLTFPVARVTKHLKSGRYAKRISKKAGVFVTSVIEYLVAELLELSGNIAKEHKKARIIPRHLQLAISNDEELNQMLGGVTLANAGVNPHIHEVLLPKKSKVTTKETQEL